MQKFYLTKKWLKIVALLSFLVLNSSLAATHSAPKTVLVVGDSLSAEYGLERGKGWVALLDRRIQEKKLGVGVVNASISGDTTSQALARLPNLLKQYQPTTVIIELGGNDGLRGLPLSESAKNFRAMIADCKTAQASVLLVGMQIPPNFGRSYTEEFSAMYGKIAKDSKVTLVPFFLDGVADKNELFQADHIHLTAEAHPRILDNVWPHLLPLIKK